MSNPTVRVAFIPDSALLQVLRDWEIIKGSEWRIIKIRDESYGVEVEIEKDE